MLDQTVIGAADKDVVISVDPSHLSAYAEAIGETNSVYFSKQSALKAGYPDILIPLTYYFSLGLLRERPLGFLEDRSVDLKKILHGEQSFRYTRLAFAGESLMVSRRVGDFYRRKSGELLFIVVETRICDASGDLVATSSETLVLPRHPPIEKSVAREPIVHQKVDPGGLHPLRPGVVTKALLRRFAHASGDQNPVHTDRLVARAAGYDDVFAHGMLSMAWLGRLLTDATRQENVHSFTARFSRRMPLHARPICNGLLRKHDAPSGDHEFDLSIQLYSGQPIATGAAAVARS
ncbi:FAS1-like dehydratase domain-containing protein [Microvirga antarctica]|uniref:FAS1-like dehydratase domain-containing protein n=1 Tax=Microvirga antarctica TaxID=2819233 RepID=UPI001FE61617|nr:MaoC family dehydratase N-terminal domain-containing protein [Microvirga antarctica]